jgi:hypothetical protein
MILMNMGSISHMLDLTIIFMDDVFIGMSKPCFNYSTFNVFFKHYS